MSRDFDRSSNTELEPSYRRRQKAVVVSRRNASGSRRLLAWTAKTVLLILPIAAALLLLAWYVLNSSRFDLAGTDAVILRGNRFVSPAEVTAAVGAGAQPNLFRLSLEEARRQVETIPWVRSASLRRVYPNRLEVDVIERKPIAFVNLGGGVKLVDADGVNLEKPADSSFDFPVLTGIDSSMSLADRRARLALFDQFAQELKLRASGAAWVVSEADLSDLADLKALLVEGRQTILVHFGDKDFGQRFDTFLALLPQVERSSSSVDSVDLRYRGQVVVSPKEPADAKAELQTAR
jgi:cell division protein FtsQ